MIFDLASLNYVSGIVTLLYVEFDNVAILLNAFSPWSTEISPEGILVQKWILSSQELSMNHASTSLTFPQQTFLCLEGWFVEMLSTDLLAQSYPPSKTVCTIFTIACFSASKLKFVTFTASFITFILSTTGSISIHTTSHFVPWPSCFGITAS